VKLELSAERRAFSAAELYLSVVLGEYCGSFSLPRSICEMQSLSISPRKGSGGAALGSATFLISVSVP